MKTVQFVTSLSLITSVSIVSGYTSQSYLTRPSESNPNVSILEYDHKDDPLNHINSSISESRFLAQRIVGGDPATFGEFPWYAKGKGGFYCGSSLIRNDVLLTAAHCFKYFDRGALIGITNLTSSNQVDTIPMVSYHLHPNYIDATNENDIMLIKLERGPNVPVPLVAWNKDRTIPSNGEVVRTIGFGRVTASGSLSKVLRKVDINVIDYQTCANDYSNYSQHPIDEQMICAGILDVGGKDSCDGDSGGPLIRQSSGTNIIVGIVAWGEGCASEDYPGVYTRVSTYDQWIQETMCAITSFPCGSSTTNPPAGPKTTRPPTQPPTMAKAPTRPPTQLSRPTNAPTNKPGMVPPVQPKPRIQPKRTRCYKDGFAGWRMYTLRKYSKGKVKCLDSCTLRASTKIYLKHTWKFGTCAGRK
jgi:Trypsin